MFSCIKYCDEYGRLIKEQNDDIRRRDEEDYYYDVEEELHTN